MAHKRKTITARRPSTATVATARRPRPVSQQKTKGPGWKYVTFDALDKWRKDNNLSQLVACEIWDVSRSYYQIWQRGLYTPSIVMQKRMKKIISKEAPPQTPKKKLGSKGSGKPNPKKSAQSKGSTETASQSQPKVTDETPTDLEVVTAINATANIIRSRIEHGAPVSDDDLVKLTGRIQQALLGDFDF